MRTFYTLILICSCLPASLFSQNLYDRLKCEGPEEVYGPVSSMEILVNPGRSDHRKRKAHFEFDGQGHLVEKEMKGERWVFEYDEEDRIVTSRRYYKEYLQEIRKRQYRGDKVMEAVYHSDGKTLIRSIFMEMDESMRPVEMEVRFPNSREKIVQFAHFGEDQIEIVKFAKEGVKIVESHYGHGCIDHVMKRSLNAKGQLLREFIKKNTDQGVIFMEHIYQYDDMGNWISQKTYRHKRRKSELLQEITRDIQYRET